jgi:dinuclear metal center YbgI/SA1388 family protein
MAGGKRSGAPVASRRDAALAFPVGPITLVGMVPLPDLTAYCDERTQRSLYTDAPGAFNGLQLANHRGVSKIGAAVDVGVVPFRAAVAAGVDFLIVHHGMFWDQPRVFTGPLFERLATLVSGGCALYSSHLPLDGHQELGNNAILARQLGLEPTLPFLVRDGQPIGWAAASTLRRDSVRAALERAYPRVTALEYGSAAPARIAFCSGSGNSAVPELLRSGIDTLVTGELREEWFPVAQDYGLNLYLCGHYATEVHGVQALAADVARRFGLPWTFLRTENPL